MKHYAAQLLEGYQWKVIVSVVGTAIGTIQGFYTDLIWLFLAMFIFDLLTGLGKSWKNGVPITSKRLRDSVLKLGSYMILVTAVIIASRYDDRFASVVSVVYWYFILTEFKSILENVEEMGVKVPGPLKSLINFRLKVYQKDDTKPTGRRKKKDTKEEE